jgi:predicted transcriptional regulator
MKKNMLFEAVAVLLLIFLIFLMYVMVTPNSSASQKWALSGVASNASGGVYNNMFIGNNGTVYTVNGTSVNAISPEGQLQWSKAIPNLLEDSPVASDSNTNMWKYVDASTDNGTLYIVLSNANFIGEELLALSPQGNLIWSNTITPTELGSRCIYAKNGYVYVLSAGDVLTVYNSMGVEKWDTDGVYTFPVVNDTGTVFILKGLPGFEVDICTQDGVNLYHNYISVYGLGEGTINSYLLYNNQIIYLPLENGLVALYENGSVKWKYSYYVTPQNPTILLYGNSASGSSPFDAEGNIYLKQGSRVFYISPDGSYTTITHTFNESLNGAVISLDNGLLYSPQILSANNSYAPEFSSGTIEPMISMSTGIQSASEMMGNRTLGQLNNVQISAIGIHAIGLASDQEEWNYTLPLEEHTTTLTASNYKDLVPYSDAITKENTETPDEWYQSNNITPGEKIVIGTSYLDMATYNSTLYVNFWSLNYEYPTFFGQSECTYAGGIYAIDKNGTLLWYTPTDSMVSSMQENNGTIYYSTLNGKLYGNSINAVAGFVLTAAVYLFLRFFLAGAVVRARKKIDSNKNRNQVLKFINDNPGVSLYDITKSLNINKGTVRYHLMILSLNHRITLYKADDKYVRYFTNSGSYSTKQQLVLSLMKREGIHKVLSSLIETPGLTNIELSVVLDMDKSSTIRYLKELLANGIILKEKTADGRQAYSINKEYKDDIEFAIRIFHRTSTSFRIQSNSPQ